MKTERKKGVFLIETLTALGIFAVFMSLTAPFIKGSLTVKNTVRDELRHKRNFIYVMENIRKEIENSSYIEISQDGNRLDAVNYTYKNGEYKETRAVYKFTEENTYGRRFLRYPVVNGIKGKDDVIFQTVKGEFFQEDGFIKMKISDKYLVQEEEYVLR